MANSPGATNLNRRFCIIEYWPMRDEKMESACERQVILVVIEEDHGLQFFAPADFRSMVDRADLEYIEQLVKDLPARSRRDAQMLFDQLCSLSVGPLVTGRVGICSAQSLDLEQICAGLIRL